MGEAETRPSSLIRQTIDEGLASGKHVTIRTYFPPESNGYPHISHAKSIYLSSGTMQDYQSQCNLRLDDTNLVKENIEYAESIKNSVEWPGFRWIGDTRYSSDYFDQLHACAIKLINKGLAYVDELSADEIREYRGTLIQPDKNSSYRDRSVEENPALFEKVCTGDFEKGKACLRVKIDAVSPSVVMHGPILYRIKFARHHQTGNKWHIYLMYDFTHCISDVLEGTTYSLYMLEFQGNHRLYDWVLDNITIPVRPRQYEFSCLNLEHTVISKRKLNLLVAGKHVEGWGDPCMLTISGLRRRGYTVVTIREFHKHIGVTKQDNTIEIAPLEFCVREDLNENVPRAVAVIDPVKLVIENYPQGESKLVTMPSRPNKPEMGSREVPFNGEIWIDHADFHEEASKQYRRLVMGKEVRLYNVYATKAERVEKDTEGNITTISRIYDADTLSKGSADGREVEGVIYWVSASHALPVRTRLYGHLLSVSNPGAAKDFLSVISPESLVIKQGYGGPSLKATVAGKVFQFKRGGYFYLNSCYATTDKLVFNRTVGLRDMWTKTDE